MSQDKGLSGMKWSFAGLQSNLIGKNADNVCRAIVSNPELVKELSDEQLNAAKTLLNQYNPTQRAKRQEKTAAQAYVNTVIGDRVSSGSVADFDGGVTINTEGPAEVTVSETETVVKTDEQTTTVQNNFEVAATAVEEQTGNDATTGKPKQTTNGNVKPDAFGNTTKGSRICKECGVSEAETLAKNSRYSFCKGMCVHCYNKVARGKGTKPGGAEENLTEEQIRGRIKFFQERLEQVLAAKTAATEGGTTEAAVTNTEDAAPVDGAPQDAKDATEELAEVS